MPHWTHCLPLSSSFSSPNQRPSVGTSLLSIQPHIYFTLLSTHKYIQHYEYFNSIFITYLSLLFTLIFFHLLSAIDGKTKSPHPSALLIRILLCLLDCYAASVRCTAQPPQHRPHIESSSHHHLHPSSSTLSTSLRQCRPITTDLSIISLRPRPHIPRPRPIIIMVADHGERHGFQLLRTRIANSAEFEA